MRMVRGLNLAGNNNPKWLKEMKDIKFSVENIVFYDNDRRKWGGVVAETNVITLEEFINYVNKEDTKLIVGGRNTSLLFFIKDVNPKCKVWRVEENQ